MDGCTKFPSVVIFDATAKKFSKTAALILPDLAQALIPKMLRIENTKM
jgi:hypothetical protein